MNASTLAHEIDTYIPSLKTPFYVFLFSVYFLVLTILN